MKQLTITQKESLQKTADHCFQNGFSSTLFARAIATHPNAPDIYSEDDFYNMYCGNQPMKEVLSQLGYGVSKYGFGIFRFSDNPNNVTYNSPSESTWN